MYRTRSLHEILWITFVLQKLVINLNSDEAKFRAKSRFRFVYNSARDPKISIKKLPLFHHDFAK